MGSSSAHSQTSYKVTGEITPLQKHVAFFDQNKDGVVYLSETYRGFRLIGSNILLSMAAALFINIGFSGKTRPGKLPDLRFPIMIENIKKAKHGSDTGTYDNEGRFVPSKFEEIFSKHAHTRPDALTWAEVKEMLKENREPSGRLASFLEWAILYLLCKDKNGYLKKDKVRGVYDGSLFEQMEKERASSTKHA